jgi:hypothetical protein
VIPAADGGHGKITVELQARTVEFEAHTAGPELPTGAEIRIVRMSSPGVFEVRSLASTED